MQLFSALATHRSNRITSYNVCYTKLLRVRLDSGDNDSWGGMQVVGELLVIFDETVLFGLLALMARYESDAFETSQTELAQIAGIDPIV